jgi:hypothetical protein
MAVPTVERGSLLFRFRLHKETGGSAQEDDRPMEEDERDIAGWKSLFRRRPIITRIWGLNGDRNARGDSDDEVASGAGYLNARARGDGRDGVPWELADDDTEDGAAD